MPVEYLSRKQLRHSGLLPKRKSSRMNLFSGMKEGYAFLIDMIIRPPRANYTLEDLGPKIFQIAGHKYERRDFEIVNSRGLKLQCSHFVSSAQLKKLAEGKDATHPCVVYLHGNCGCRVDATVALPLLLPAGFSVFCFDFSGSGLSEGEYISLGFYEKDDVTTIVEYLRGCKLVSTIGLWGRSMGAATALMFGASDPSIAGMVLDSPFSSLSKLANELVEHNAHQLPVGIPKIAVSVGMKAIRKSIINKTGLDINELSPIKFAESGFSPVLFVHGQEDDFIQPHHSRELMEKYSGEKNLIIVDGDHNSPRPEYCLDSISIFFHNTLGAMVGEEPVAEEAEPAPLPHFSEKPHFGEMYNSMPHGLVDPEDDDELLQQAMMLSLQEHEKSKDASVV